MARQPNCPDCGSLRIVPIDWSPPPGGIDPPVIPQRACADCGRPMLAAKVLQKWQETQYVHRLRDRIPELSGATIESDEEPDFFLRSVDRVIGLEVTAAVRLGSPGDLSPKERSEFQRKVRAMGRRLFSDKGLGPAWVTPFWLANNNRDQVGRVATALADLVANALPDIDQTIGWGMRDIKWEDLPASLQGQFYSVSIRRNARGTAGTWDSGFANYPDLQRDELVREVRRKEKVAAQYDRRWDELWLLVYATGQGPAEYLLLPTEAIGPPIATTFQRIFFMDAELDVTNIPLLNQVER